MEHFPLQVAVLRSILGEPYLADDSRSYGYYKWRRGASELLILTPIYDDPIDTWDVVWDKDNGAAEEFSTLDFKKVEQKAERWKIAS